MVDVWVNGSQRGQFIPTEAPQTLFIELDPDMLNGQTGAQVELRIATFRPSDFGQGDRRDLGMLLELVELTPVATSGQIALPSWDVIIAAVLAGFFVPDVSPNRKCSIGFALGQAGGLLIARSLVAPVLPYEAVLLGMTWFGRYIARLIVHAVSRRFVDGQTGIFKMLVAPQIVIGLLTTVWQVLVFDISKFLPAFDALIASEDAYGFAFDDALRVIRTQTPPDAIVQVDPNLGQAGMEISVAANRRSLFVHTTAWLFQTPLAQYAGRRGRIERAFSVPTLVEACSIFHELGINVILIEPQARAYNWLVDKDEPESCFKTLYQGELVTVLEVVK